MISQQFVSEVNDIFCVATFTGHVAIGLRRQKLDKFIHRTTGRVGCQSYRGNLMPLTDIFNPSQNREVWEEKDEVCVQLHVWVVTIKIIQFTV